MKVYDGRKYRIVLKDGTEVSGICQILPRGAFGVTPAGVGIWQKVGGGRGGLTLVDCSSRGIDRIYELADECLGELELDDDL